MNVRIRLLTAQDAIAFRNLQLKSYIDSPLAFSESYEDEVQRSESDFASELTAVGSPVASFVLGAFSASGELLGFVKFRRDQRLKARHKAMIHAAYVDPGHRCRGIAQKLISELLRKAKQLPGLEQIHLWVLHSDNSASGFYKKCGFESQGTVVKHDLKINGSYVDAEYMVLYLAD